MVTFDLFSALIDSRAGGSVALQRLASPDGWQGSGEELYDLWDASNKQAQQECQSWRPYADLAQEALAAAYARLGLHGDATTDIGELLASMADWPLWPDVQRELPLLGGSYRIGLLSNVDDALFESTRAAPLVAPEFALTSERLQAYKPSPRIYHRAVEAAGALVHIATSARDVRGALEAGIRVIRLRRPGHQLDLDGPEPPLTVDGLAGLDAVLQQLLTEERQHRR